ncbi:MAG TPA: DUF5947 family protein [Bryobacteraceae bacterium]|jgi:hypothetical protein|nr:DUF5947 family protein [Bryobacteraceae bacterium]
MTATHPIQSLRRFVPAVATRARERCEMCSLPLGAAHRHLFDSSSRNLICACDACVLLFPGSGEAKYRAVPRRVRRLVDFTITDAQWNGLAIPIGLAFFFRQPDAERIVAIYPSPAGTTESELPLESWNELADVNPTLRSLEPDVETLLVNRTRQARDYYIAPIDRCYELAGTVRKHWRGLSGGSAVWEAIDQFFARMNAEAHA